MASSTWNADIHFRNLLSSAIITGVPSESSEIDVENGVQN